MMDMEFDGKIYYPYTDDCKDSVLKRLEKYYPKEEINQIMDDINSAYFRYLGEFNRDLKGKKNSRNGLAGTYDCIFLFCVYERCKEKISYMDLEDIAQSLLTPSFAKLSFVDLNKPFFKKLFYIVLKSACKRGNKFNDYHAEIDAYDKKKPLHYWFTSCPVAEFAKQFGFEDVLPYLCNADFYSIAMMKAKLVRPTTLGNGVICDYEICGDKDPYLIDHEEYRDENGYIRNK